MRTYKLKRGSHDKSLSKLARPEGLATYRMFPQILTFELRIQLRSWIHATRKNAKDTYAFAH